MKSTSSIGINFETDHVELIAMARSLRGVTVKGTVSLPMTGKEGGKEEFLRRAEEFIEEFGGAKSALSVAVPRSQAILTRLTLPSPTEENLTEAVGYELDRNTPYSREETYFDCAIIGRDVEGGTISVIQATILKKKLDPCLELLKDLGLTPCSVELTSTAAANAFLDDARNRKGRFILTTFVAGAPELIMAELIMIDDGAFNYSRCFQAVSAPGVEMLPEMLPEILPEILPGILIDELQRVTRSMGWSVESITGIVLDRGSDGEGGRMAEEIERETGIRCSVLDIHPAGPGPGNKPFTHIVPYGLALRGVEESRAPLNFLSQERVSMALKARYSTAVPLVAALILLGIAALTAPLLLGYNKLKSIEKEIESLEPDVSYVEELKREAGEIQGGLEQLSAAGSGGWPVLFLLKELTRIIPVDTWFTNFVHKNDTVEITGYSSSASSLIPIIERSPFFTGVEFTAPVTTVNRSSAIRGFGSRSISGRVKGVPGKSGGGSMEQFKIRAYEEKRL